MTSASEYIYLNHHFGMRIISNFKFSITFNEKAPAKIANNHLWLNSKSTLNFELPKNDKFVIGPLMI